MIAICIVVILRFSGSKARAAETEPTTLRPVAVVLAGPSPIVNALNLSGAFRAFQEVDVHAKVAGYIKHIYVDVGDKVKQGQVLAILEVPELNAQVVGAKADLQRGQNAIHRAQSEIERAQSSHSAYHAAYTRLKQASAAKPGLIAEQELDDALAKDKTSESDVVSAQAALAESESQLAAAQANLERLSALEGYAHITAPFEGVVTKRYADTGALIQAGTASDTQSLPVVQPGGVVKTSATCACSRVSRSPRSFGIGCAKFAFPLLIAVFKARLHDLRMPSISRHGPWNTEIDVENREWNAGRRHVCRNRSDTEANRWSANCSGASNLAQRHTASVMVVNRQGMIEERQVTLGEEGADRVEIKSGLSPQRSGGCGKSFRPQNWRKSVTRR